MQGLETRVKGWSMDKFLSIAGRHKALALGLLILLLGSIYLTASADEESIADPPSLPAPTPPDSIPPAGVGPHFLLSDPDATVFLPLVLKPQAGFPVDPQDRQASLDFFVAEYLPSEGVAIMWSGDHGSCNPGTTSAAFQQAVLRRINYFRAMAGIPAQVTFSDASLLKAQAAALMMSVNRQLSHSPPAGWTGYSSEGAQGAGSANLYLGVNSWDAITGYMRDPGSGNYFVGHRRWILYPQTQVMGTGDIPATQGYPAANALVVFDSHMWEPRPVTRDEFVAWPPPGYVPYQVVFPRWSFAYASADFSSASVTMTSNGSSISLNQASVLNGYGENTLVWIPLGLNDGAGWPLSGADTTYSVDIRNVVVNGQSREFSYQVIVFDPTP